MLAGCASLRAILNLRAPHTCAVQGCGFLTLHSLFLLADSDPACLFALYVAHERKTRTLHENREECGTQSWANRPHRGIKLAATFLRRKQEKRTICEPVVQLGNSG